MAGVSSKEIKNRIRSMEATRQITKAMEMVATSKLRRVQERALATRPYFKALYAAVHEIAGSDRDFYSAYLQPGKGSKALYIVIAGDRGLAGGYNSNVLRFAVNEIGQTDAEILPIGKKAVEFFKNRRVPMLSLQYAQAADMSIGDCFTVAKALCKQFLTGAYSEIYVCYTDFVSVLAQSATSLRLLPLLRQETDGEKEENRDILYEPDSAQVFEKIVPEYLGGILYGALCESRASEQAARRNAMDAATQNADEMIDKLSLEFNRARQGAITQEITEIVAGS